MIQNFRSSAFAFASRFSFTFSEVDLSAFAHLTRNEPLTWGTARDCWAFYNQPHRRVIKLRYKFMPAPAHIFAKTVIEVTNCTILACRLLHKLVSKSRKAARTLPASPSFVAVVLQRPIVLTPMVSDRDIVFEVVQIPTQKRRAQGFSWLRFLFS